MGSSKFIFKLLLLLFIVSNVSAKTLVKRNVTETDINEVSGERKEDKMTEQVNSEETNSEASNSKEEKNKEGEEKPENLKMQLGNLDPTSSTHQEDLPRAYRTIQKIEMESPAQLIENFRNKLKAARSNIETTLARRASEPRLSIFETQDPRGLQITHPTLSSLFAKTVEQPVEQPTIPTQTEEKKIITSPIKDSSSSEEEKPGKMRQNEESGDISHLLHVRDEINKIRAMMQSLREQQLRQQFGTEFPNNKNISSEETKHIASVIDKLKEEGKISTKPLSTPEEGFQNHPPETTKLVDDIRKLKQSILSFANQVQGPKNNIESIEELEKQIQQQREEINTLKKLVDDLQPPKQFPFASSMMKQPINVKTDLHHELQTLQNILNELLKKEEARDRLRSSIASKMRSSEEPKSKDEEIATIMKIVQSMSPSNRQSNIETKLEKIERNLKDLDTENQRTRHEMILQKLEQDIKMLKNKPSDDELKEKLQKLEEELKKQGPLSKITTMEKKLETIKPQGRDIPSNIDKELDKLQLEIDMMTLKNLDKNKQPMSSRQLEGLFTEILNTEDDHDHVPSATVVKPLLPIKKPVVTKEVTISKPTVPEYKPVFQIPFCLHKYTNGQPYVIANPDYHPEPAKVIPASETTATATATQTGYEHPKVTPVETKTPIPQPVYQKPVVQKEVKIEVPAAQKVVEETKPQTGYAAQKEMSQQQQKVETTGYVSPKPQPKPTNGYGMYKPSVQEESTPQKVPQQPINGYESSYQPAKAQTNIQNGYESYTPPKPEPPKPYYPSQPETGYGPEPYQYQYQQPPKPEYPQPNYGYDNPQYQPYKPPCSHHANIEEEMNHLNGMISNLDEKIQYAQDLQPNYGMYRNKPRNKRQVEEDLDKKEVYKDLQQRLQNLREAVEGASSNDNENEVNPDFQRTAYNPEGYSGYDNNYPLKLRRRQKFDNLFIKIVKFILHKLEISAPYVVESLFDGEAFDYEPEGNYRMRSAEDGYEEEEDIQKNIGGFFNNFQGFKGLLGFIPTVLFKLLSNFSSFLSILKRNSFFKNFLFPGGVILLVDGILALLIWWFSTDENHNLLTFQNSSYVN